MAVLFLERHSLYNSPCPLSLSMLHKDFKQWNKCHSSLFTIIPRIRFYPNIVDFFTHGRSETDKTVVLP